MIGEADTKARRPRCAEWVDGYAKGVNPVVQVTTKVTGLSYAFDDFDTTDAWIPVHGTLRVSGGATSDVYSSWSYAAGYHVTQMLTDNCRAKVVVQDGVMSYGESRVFICSDTGMNRYYGLAIRHYLGASSVAIIRGTSDISVDRYAEAAITVSAGDTFDVWYDRINSTVRVYQNDAEVASQYFSPQDIPHGPGNRYSGVVMGLRLINGGPRFTSFEAWDEDDPAPTVYDPIDGDDLNAGWIPVDFACEVHTHLFYPNSIGPIRSSHETAAVRWTDPVGTDSVKVVCPIMRHGSGTFTIVVRSSNILDNWIGVRFIQEVGSHTVEVVTGTSFQNITQRTVEDLTLRERLADRLVLQYGDVITVTWDEDNSTITAYLGASRTPIIEYDATGVFTPTGRYVGLIWEVSVLGQDGVEPTSFAAYDVTPTQPLP